MTVDLTDLLAVVIPSVALAIGWATYVTRMIWEIKTDVSARSARQDTRLDDLEKDVGELQTLLPRHIPNQGPAVT